MPPEFVFLDLGRVLVSFDQERAITRAAAISGADRALVAEVLRDDSLHEAIERGLIPWVNFYEEFCRRTGTSPDLAALADAVSDMFSLKIEMLPLMARLARCGCGLGILSNTCAPHWNHLVTTCGYGVLTTGLDTIVLSHEVGCRKPELKIYDVAARMAGVSPENIFFADDIPAHVDAARAAGWDAEIFTTAVALAEHLCGRGLSCGL